MVDQRADSPGDRVVAFPPLAARLRAIAAVLAVATLLAMVVDGIVRGLSFGAMVVWVSVYGGSLLIATAVLVALHALRGADRAQRRGERLSGDDVGLVPRRRRD